MISFVSTSIYKIECFKLFYSVWDYSRVETRALGGVCSVRGAWAVG